MLSAGLAGPDVVIPALVGGDDPILEGAAAEIYHGFAAPFAGLPDEAFNGLRRFPLSIPFDNYDNGSGAAQTHYYRTLLDSRCPAHFIWGCTDDIFSESWGRTWAERMNASFDPITDAGHFLQNTHGRLIAETILARIGDDAGSDR